jgi:phosphonopyruvate decarboxylase
MLSGNTFVETVLEAGISLFCGVPDSVFRDLCTSLDERLAPDQHIITANEGSAVALATGHYLGSGGLALVYMQNSGLGNAINPIASLASKNVYGIPMLLLIGWRGEPGTPDEPQHVLQGLMTLPHLDAMGIRHSILPPEIDSAVACLNEAVEAARKDCCPVALIVRRDTFESSATQVVADKHFELSREQAIRIVADCLSDRDVIVSTTGMISRELFEHRQSERQTDVVSQDFLVVGSMGHASQIALGLALARPDRRIVCLDGDGALLMHMGGLATIGSQSPENLIHVILNNGCHDSVGGQPTVGFAIDIAEIALACTYRHSCQVISACDLKRDFTSLIQMPGPSLIEIRVSSGHRNGLSRPSDTPRDRKVQFMTFLEP